MWLVRREKSSSDSSFRVYFDRRQSAHAGRNPRPGRTPCWVADFLTWAAAELHLAAQQAIVHFGAGDRPILAEQHGIRWDLPFYGRAARARERE